MTEEALMKTLTNRLGYHESSNKEELVKGAMMAHMILSQYYKEELDFKDRVIKQRTDSMNSYAIELQTIGNIILRHADKDILTVC